MHLTSQVSIVFLSCLEELHVTIRSIKLARVPDGLHFGGSERLKAACDFEILVQNAQGIDAADGHRNRQAHGIA